jgi:dTDP-4-dehydrorhamnose reductase
MKKPTILLTGKTGQIGAELCRLLPQLGNLFVPGRRELDFSNAESVRRVIRETRPHLIINAAAYTAVDAAENDKSNAYAVNTDAPALLAEEAKRLDALLVHYSTDYVFDGSKQSPYNETDETSPLNIYGKSKLGGEEAIRASGVSHLIFRTGWVYAHRGRNFLLTILRLATEREELRIVCDQIGAPTCAMDIAAATTKILTDIYRGNTGPRLMTSLSSTYHMTAAGETTWYNFAKAILEKAPMVSTDFAWFAAATRGRPLIARRIVPISTEEFRSPTRRPNYSVLSNTHLSQTFQVALPDWAVQLQCCLATARLDETQPGSISAQSSPSFTPQG